MSVLAKILSDFPDRYALGEKRGVVKHRPQRHLGHGERNDAGRMGMNHRHHIRTRLVDFTVNEALQKYRPAPRIHGIAVEIELHDVVGGDQRRRQRARH
jgi:hypothetical protein